MIYSTYLAGSLATGAETWQIEAQAHAIWRDGIDPAEVARRRDRVMQGAAPSHLTASKGPPPSRWPGRPSAAQPIAQHVFADLAGRGLRQLDDHDHPCW
jgi:hypothetical protein